MQDFEKLGVFYLGREYDPEARATLDAPILYDSRDLVTHGVIIGMTGSGKTGLAIDLLEEAAIDGVPAIAIDPKGDLGNLLLTFPGLSAGEFLPWIDQEEAARRGLTAEQFAEQQAAFWKDGLARWGQDGARIERLRGAADVAIYTPGSTTGIPLSVLKSFAPPPPEVLEDGELFADRVGATVTGLLALVGMDADPVTSREHILLSTIVGAAWRGGESPDLAALIQRVQSPPVSRVGVLEVESFFPSKERFDLAMRLNGLLAAPGFGAWLEGDGLDVDRLLYTAEGRPRLAVVSIAHLNDAERMFFVAMLLQEVLAWVRRQPGTTSLRALLYMDEVAGYMPPVANPPSKAALLTLLKQGRAFGVGVVLATQNTVDLDYKGLSNAGTWFLGRLQTERDKARVLDGLEGAMAGAQRFDRAEIDRLLSSLGKRVFLLHNVHDNAPRLFETRWAMSYLRGPLTRDQIRSLMAPRRGQAAAPVATAPADAENASVVPSGPPPDASARPGAAPPPVLPPEIVQLFVPARDAQPVRRYDPCLCGAGEVGFEDAKLGVHETRACTVLVPIVDGPLPVDWNAAVESEIALADFAPHPVPGAAFGELPAAAAKARQYATWEKELGRWLARTQTLRLLREPLTGLTSRPGEGEREFRVRLAQALRERRDGEKAKLETKYAARRASLAVRIRRAEEKIAREEQQASQQKMQTAVSFGATLIGALFSRKKVSVGNVGRATTAARGVGRSMKEDQDVQLAEQNFAKLKEQLAALDDEIAAAAAGIDAGVDAAGAPLEPVDIKPKRTQVAVRRVALAWVPG